MCIFHRGKFVKSSKFFEIFSNFLELAAPRTSINTLGSDFKGNWPLRNVQNFDPTSTLPPKHPNGQRGKR